MQRERTNLSERAVRVLLLLVAIDVSCLVVANASAVKLIGSGWFVFTVGALVYPITYTVQDVVSEVYGERRARWVVFCAFVACVVMALFLRTAVAIPEADVSTVGACFPRVFDATPRLTGASLGAALLGGLVNTRVFAFLRHTRAEGLTASKMGSTMAGQALDSVVFTHLAFVGVLPYELVWGMAGAQYLAKVAVAAASLPLSHAAIRLAR